MANKGSFAPDWFPPGKAIKQSVDCRVHLGKSLFAGQLPGNQEILTKVGTHKQKQRDHRGLDQSDHYRIKRKCNPLMLVLGQIVLHFAAASALVTLLIARVFMGFIRRMQTPLNTKEPPTNTPINRGILLKKAFRSMQAQVR